MLIDYVESVEFVTLNESSSFIDTLRIMNQFDIMISLMEALVNILFTFHLIPSDEVARPV